jgi:hypothetical protein
VVWERLYQDCDKAVDQPAQNADYLIAFDDDMVAKAAHAHPEGLQNMFVLHVEGQPSATIYRSLARTEQTPQ